MDAFNGMFEPKSLDVALSTVIKMGISVVLTGLIGFERERARRPAGIRTHMLVAIGVVLFCEASKAFGGDPSRIASGIVTGIGFLGAGTIMRTGAEVKGLTTAASIWASAGIAMAISLGGSMLLVALIATWLTFVTLAVVDNLERKFFPQNPPYILRVNLAKSGALPGVLQALISQGADVREAKVDDSGPGVAASIKVGSRSQEIIQTTLGCEGVTSVQWAD